MKKIRSLRDAPLGILLGHSANSARQYVDSQVKDYGITPVQSQAIMILHDHSGSPFSQKDLERELMLKGSTVNGIVDRLEEKGLIIRRTCPSDGRRNELVLTEAGEQMRLCFKETLKRAESALCRGFSGEELEQFRDYLLRLISSIEEMEG